MILRFFLVLVDAALSGDVLVLVAAMMVIAFSGW